MSATDFGTAGGFWAMSGFWSLSGRGFPMMLVAFLSFLVVVLLVISLTGPPGLTSGSR